MTECLNKKIEPNYSIAAEKQPYLNTYTFTWLEKIQPILDTAQIKLMNEKEIWTNKCREKRVKTLHRLCQIYAHVDDLKYRDKYQTPK